MKTIIICSSVPLKIYLEYGISVASPACLCVTMRKSRPRDCSGRVVLLEFGKKISFEVAEQTEDAAWFFNDEDLAGIKIEQVGNEDFPEASCYLLSSNFSAKG